MPIFTIAVKSLLNRKSTATLTIIAIAISVTLLLGVERIRSEARSSFANTISGTDLIIGARGGSIQLLLYSVFRIGNATNNISWGSYRKFAELPSVAWTIPLSLGDSHLGYRVLGTTGEYFRHYRYGAKRKLQFLKGVAFDDIFDAVLGAEVAEKLGYRVGDPLIVTHGIAKQGGQDHGDKPFRVSGVLAKTGTPVDQTIHVSLAGIEAIHIDWRGGAKVTGFSITADEVRGLNLQPKSITAFLVGLNSRLDAFRIQRQANIFDREPLTAILPGVALHELWSVLGTAETALSVISFFVIATSILGMLTVLLAGVNERRREFSVLRSVGARTRQIFTLHLIEALFLTAAGIVIGTAVLYALLLFSQPIIEDHYGLFINIGPPTKGDIMRLTLVLLAGLIAGIAPAWRAYKSTLADGLNAQH
ncbi:MAG: peptide ABC transporter permease [Rhodospirillaceae bacterium]|nr:peptide ABC transporter permease [Rhodospirillaceae bacterium]